MVRWSLDDLWSMKLITRKPLFCIMCCWTVCDVSTSSQMKPNNFELQRETWLAKSPVSPLKITYHKVGSRLASEEPLHSYGRSNWENNGNKTWIPPIELSVLWMEYVITAFTSWKFIGALLGKKAKVSAICGDRKMLEGKTLPKLLWFSVHFPLHSKWVENGRAWRKNTSYSFDYNSTNAGLRSENRENVY